MVYFGGLRLAHRVFDAQTEINPLLGQAVITGCSIQTPTCLQGWAFNIEIRRYLTKSKSSPYVGLNLHRHTKGIRWSSGPSLLADLSLGFNYQTSGSFNRGLGYSFFGSYGVETQQMKS